MNRKAFFDAIRRSLFGGALTQEQVEGMDAILDAWAGLLEVDAWPDIDLRWIAYCLATAWWETGRRMAPCREDGLGQGRPYGLPDPVQVYYGRGLVQLTWRTNYEKQQAKLGLPLVDNPDLALTPGTAARILLRGMADGDFTGRALKHYFREDGTSDPVQARTIVNGLDHAGDIASAYDRFLAALAEAHARLLA